MMKQNLQSELINLKVNQKLKNPNQEYGLQHKPHIDLKQLNQEHKNKARIHFKNMLIIYK